MALILAGSDPHRNILLLQKTLHIAHGVGAEMEDARGEDGIHLLSLKASRWA